MGLFNSIRRVVGGGDTDDDDDAATQPDLVDTHDLDEATLRERAAGVAGEVEVLDFSLDSLAQFDEAIDAGYDEELATSDAPGAYATDTVRFGCYLGEVLVRTYDGEWTRTPDWGVTITGPDGTTTVAVFDVAERSITTGSVFAAVADRAAVEVGLDGVTADSDPEPSAPDAGGDIDGDTEPAADVATTGEDTDETPAVEETDEATDDAGVSGAPDDTPTDAPSMGEASEDEPAVDGPSEGSPTTDVSGGRAPTDATAVPDPAETDPTPSESDDESGAESLIEEAEPELAAEDGSVPTDDTDATADEPGGTDAPSDETAPEQGTDPSESLFDDGATGTGPTVDDAPSAEDGAPVPPFEGDGVDRDDGTVGSDGVSEERDSAVPSDETDSSGEPADAGDPADGDGLRATYAEAAEELVSFWTEYELDYTADSLDRLDDLVSEEWDDDRFDDADFGSDDSFDDRVFTSVSTELGSYFGEVLIRELDAEWSDETATDGVVVEGAEGPLAIPVFKVAGTSIKQQPVFARSYDSLLSDLKG